MGGGAVKGECYIVGAGERTEDLFAPGPDDLVIAADGGYSWLQEQGIVPGLVVGDFDSLSAPPERPNVVRLPKEKDETDTMAALHMGLERGYGRFRLYSGTGGRFDHTLANLQLLAWLARRGRQGFLYARGWTATAVTDGSVSFPAGERGTISVFSQSDVSTGVYLEGLKYPLTDAALTNDFALGVSNEFTGSPARIAVGKGTLLVVWAR